jgi:hypothetical protein
MIVFVLLVGSSEQGRVHSPAHVRLNHQFITPVSFKTYTGRGTEPEDKTTSNLILAAA